MNTLLSILSSILSTPWPIWIFVGAVLGVGASARNGFNVLAGVFLGAVFGPFAVLLFWIPGENTPQARVCPFCAETVKGAATVCKHCGRDLPATSTTDVNRKGRCRACHAIVPEGATSCPQCRARVRVDYRLRRVV